MTRDRISLLTTLVIAAALALPGSVADAAKAKSKATKTTTKSTAKSAPKGKDKAKAAAPAAAGKAVAPAVAVPAATGAALAPAPAGAARSLGIPPLPLAPSTSTSHMDLSTVKRALDLIRRNKADEATALKATIADPVAVKLIEWAVLRSDSNSGMSFERYIAFINANPTWPSIPMLRRRTETSLWDDNLDAGAIRAFYGSSKPTTAKGRFALARALLAQGDRAGAAHYVREAWRFDAFSRELETIAYAEFGPLLTAADIKVRMDRRP